MGRGWVVLGLVLVALLGSATAAAAESTQTVAVVVDDGDLLVSVDRAPMALPAAEFVGAWYATTGTLPGLTVVDTRAGNPGWSAAGQFADDSGGTPLSWSPAVVGQSPVQVLTPGSATIGMRGSRVLAVADPSAGRGTAHLTAGFRLLVARPTGYTATLTLTVI
ncbi:hypothetical protein [Actinokineospora diospyrosa]|uniref:Lipocalin-like protein n=1 Tax=Actinokineospora diospyrosa TaxID=103728 RepID=A0ABT1I962_9PSEU|nr:hypothetical protein [Actinokineospora diospyrosa]MCP2269174.1 hypothetical protein [Actinokineospora diospyrosa]